MTITEPATMLTDYLLVAVSWFFADRLFRLAQVKPRRSLLFWVAGFVCSAAAALIGGTYHGFALYLSDAIRPVLWNLTIWLVAAAAGFMILACTKMPPMKKETRRLLISGLFLSLIGLGMQRSGIQLHPHFNHNDIYHLIQTGALYCFYRAALLA